MFASPDLALLPAKLLSGLTFQSGWAVVRPGWVAFLPSSGRRDLVATTLLGMLQVFPGDRATCAYDFASMRARGPDAFDREVQELATRDGLVIQATHGDVGRFRKGVMFRADEKTSIMCDASPPEPLLIGWRRTQPRFNPRAEAKVFAALTSIPGGIAAIVGVIAYRARDPDIHWGVGFWLVLALLPWIAFGVRYYRAKRSSAQAS
ncbi:MAG: hypothetical protein HOV80_29395 [Polyangiaceae bacterium]|nr:hypothetical protein [Polyangiaceae bacterium]